MSYGERYTVIPSHNTYDVKDFHALYPLFGHPFTLRLGALCVRTYVQHQHTLAQPYGWFWVRNFPISTKPYGWVWVWNFPYIDRLKFFIYGDVVGDVLWSNTLCFDFMVVSIKTNPFVLPCNSSNKISYPLPRTFLSYSSVNNTFSSGVICFHWGCW